MFPRVLEAPPEKRTPPLDDAGSNSNMALWRPMASHPLGGDDANHPPLVFGPLRP